MDKLTLLVTFFNPAEAYMAKGKLESEGIESFIFDELAVSYIPLMASGIRLMVRGTDLERARKILSRDA